MNKYSRHERSNTLKRPLFTPSYKTRLSLEKTTFWGLKTSIGNSTGWNCSVSFGIEVRVIGSVASVLVQLLRKRSRTTA